MELKSLNVLKLETESKYKNRFSFGERRLPKSFKELITQFDNDRITYNEFSFIVQRTSEGIIVAPNQWLYIAAFYSSYYKELLAYKEELYNHLLPKYDNKKNALEEPIKACFDNFENAKSLLEHYPNGQNKDYLIRFLSDYKWWGGAKTIDRSDFCASAILSSAGLVNAAQGYVADVCKFLAKNPEAENILLTASISEEDNSTTTTKNEILRQVSAATFLRKALKIVIEEDANLSKLEALNQYKETNKQLKINGFNLWRKKDDLPLRLEDVCQDLEIEYNGLQYVMYLEWTPAGMERLFFSVFNSAYNGKFSMCKEENEYVLYKINQSRKEGKVDGYLQQIFYGAPGTGKSHKIKDNEDVKKADEKNLVFRTTFHPDSDYSTFVGAYKPTMRPVPNQYKAVAGKDEEITYEFIPQAFLQAYIAAWNNSEKKVFLVIEEINRGNCAQIFGDLFQLLDRDDNGFSEYPIKADRDLANYLKGKDNQGIDVLTNKDGIKDGKLQLPKNLYIWATMNTSDQSLFPIDSAFKRRWDWVYMPIADAKKNYVIEIDNDQYDWWSFLEAINAIIENTTHSEDKKLGYFFAKAKDGRIIVETFVSKVIFYLWNDVFKDNETNHKAFKDNDGELLPFRKFFHHDGTVDTNMVIKFLQDLEVFPFEHSDDGTTAVSDIIPNTKRQRDKSRYRVNGTDNLNKAQMTREAFRLYIEAHPDADAQTIEQAWNGLGLKDYVRHLVETEDEYNARTKDSTDSNKRATEFELSNGEKIYLSTQFGIGNIGKFMDAVNNAGWNIRIENQA